MTNGEKFREVQAKARAVNLEIHRIGGCIRITGPDMKEVMVDDLEAAQVYIAAWIMSR